jgi:hypothetical protein
MPESDNINTELKAFVHENGYPFALVFPEDWRFTYEYVDIGEAYPTRLEYINQTVKTKPIGIKMELNLTLIRPPRYFFEYYTNAANGLQSN